MDQETQESGKDLQQWINNFQADMMCLNMSIRYSWSLLCTLKMTINFYFRAILFYLFIEFKDMHGLYTLTSSSFITQINVIHETFLENEKPIKAYNRREINPTYDFM